ncbi:MAG: DUF3822 family protein [Bacteroidota bacterium]
MNSSFIIQPTRLNTESADLYLKINPQGIAYIILENNTCMGLATFHFPAGATDAIVVASIHELMKEQPVLQQAFKNVYIIYGYPQSILVPNELMNEENNKAMLDLVFGDASDAVVRNEYVYRHLIHNVYSVPAEVDAVLARYFELGSFTHLYSLLPDVIKNSGTHLYCIFDTGQLTTVLLKEGKLQVVQSYCYKTPDDVAYYLLNICQRFETDLSVVTVHLSGMIDATSALYSELYKYFLNVFFEALPEEYEYPESISKYPPHYFSHLFAVASCV